MYKICFFKSIPHTHPGNEANMSIFHILEYKVKAISELQTPNLV